MGAVQGLTEFLPVSSSAHLILVPWLLHWQDPGLAFDVALHLGTLLALLAYYWRQWLEMGLSLANGQKLPRRLLFLLIVASIPGAIIGLLLEKQAETIFRSPLLIAIDLAVMGIALWVVDRVGAQRRTIDDIGLIDALVIGLSQALAIVPGVSRSGATITAARMLGIDRESAANFSFLMATPIIAGAGMMEIHKALRGGLTAQISWGFVAAAIFGVIAIAGLLRFVRLRSYAAFSIYRIALAVLVAIVFFARG
ncbi:MAG: undecaprenyl-diphosphate phosphatase [Candidatus Binatus sp.]|nr:undecaprenyl-diphosphate phosphatase [Candidatus Binatus sp.]